MNSETQEDARSRETEDITGQSAQQCLLVPPANILMHFDLLINVADTMILVAMQPVSERLTDVASFERFAGDLSQFGH